MLRPPPEDSVAPASDPGPSAVGRILAEFDVARRERQWRDHEWWVCWQWYNGITTVFYDARPNRQGQVYEVTSTKRSTTAKPINYIGHACDLVVAKQMKARPTFDASPADASSASDKLAARAVRDVVRHLWLQNKLTSRRRDLILNRVITGNGFVKVRYDRNLPPHRLQIVLCPQCNGAKTLPVQMPPEVQAQVQQMEQLGMHVPEPPVQECPQCQGRGELDNGRRPLGDVCIQTVSPWEIYPAPGSRKIEDGVFHAWPMSREAASAAYGIPMGDLTHHAHDEAKSEFVRQSDRGRHPDDDDARIWAVERWYPPAPGREAPRLSIVVGRTLVFPTPDNPSYATGMAEVPEAYNRIPIYHFRQRPSAEEFWSEGIVLQMISANDFINRSRGNMHRHQQLMAYVKWVYQKGTVSSDQITNIAGEKLEYSGSDAPRQQSPAPMPEFYQRLHNDEIDGLYKLAGLNEMDRGIAPANIEAFQALHLLVEQSETILGPISIEDEVQWTDVALGSIICAKSNYLPTDVRMLRVVGGSAKLEVDALLKADLSDNVDVVCEIGSALAHSQALRQEQVFRAVELGILDAHAAGKMLEFGALMGEEPFDDHRLQESVAIMENEAIATQQGFHTQMILATSHDHAAHAAEHRRAALEAQIAGNQQLAVDLDAAAAEHMAYLQPPVPGGPGAAAPPVDAGAASGQPSVPPAV